MRPSMWFLTILAGIAISGYASAETVNVKYRGHVSLDPFECESVSRSSFINRVCYDADNSYMIIKLQQTYYHYCEIGENTVSSLKAAPSMGHYYNANIKGSGSDGPFDCRTHSMPAY